MIHTVTKARLKDSFGENTTITQIAYNPDHFRVDIYNPSDQPQITFFLTKQTTHPNSAPDFLRLYDDGANLAHLNANTLITIHAYQRAAKDAISHAPIPFLMDANNIHIECAPGAYFNAIEEYVHLISIIYDSLPPNPES